MSGPAPFGTMWRDGKLTPQPSETPIVTALVEAFLASGGRMKPTAAALNSKGFTTRRGASWTDVAVGRVLEQEELRGLISENLWLRCEGLLAERGALGRRSAHPLGSAVRCRCGSRMYMRGEGPAGKFICQGCRSKIPNGTLEQKLLEALNSVLLSAQELVAEVHDDPRAAELGRAVSVRGVSVAEVWPDLDVEERRQLVDSLVANVEVDSCQIRVVLAVSDRIQAETERSPSNSLPRSHDLQARHHKATRPSIPRGVGTPTAPQATVHSVEPKAYRVSQVAALLNVPKSTVYDLVRTGVLASVRSSSTEGRGIVLVPAGSVSEFLHRRRDRGGRK